MPRRQHGLVKWASKDLKGDSQLLPESQRCEFITSSRLLKLLFFQFSHLTRWLGRFNENLGRVPTTAPDSWSALSKLNPFP